MSYLGEVGAGRVALSCVRLRCCRPRMTALNVTQTSATSDGQADVVKPPTVDVD